MPIAPPSRSPRPGAAAGTWRRLAWTAVPLAVYALVVQHFWFNAPIWDDYDTVLNAVLRLRDAPSATAWIGIVVDQHNEHRIAVMRLVAWAAAALGTIDFRLLVVIGNLTLVGLFVLAVAEFREVAAPPLVIAAGFLMFQLSYYEASLMASAALPNIGVVFFSCGCLFFALRGRAWDAAWAIAFGILAAGSLANGLFALPIAAGAAALSGRRARSMLFAATAAVLWTLYFAGYVSPQHHPSTLVALKNPLAAAQLFLVVVGGIVPGRWGAEVAGALILAWLGWLARKRPWREHPTAWLWIAFVLLSCATVTVGRVGFGVFHASRYAIYSTLLVVLALLSHCASARPWNQRATVVVLAGAVLFSLGVTGVCWRFASAYALNGKVLAKAAPASADIESPAYFGIHYPDVAQGDRYLRAAESAGFYVPRRQPIYPASLETAPAPPRGARYAGHLESVNITGARVTVTGWTDLSAAIPGRSFGLLSSDAPPAGRLAAVARMDVAAAHLEPALVFSGFRWAFTYPSEEQARQGASEVCLFVTAPGKAPALLRSRQADCSRHSP